MRPHTLSLALGTALVIATAACEQARTPTIAGIAGTPSSPNGSEVALQTSPGQAQLVVGSTVQLRTNAPLALLNQIQWQSSNPAVAAVDPFGLVTALTPGTAIVRARYAFDTTQVASTAITVVGIAAGH